MMAGPARHHPVETCLPSFASLRSAKEIFTPKAEYEIPNKRLSVVKG
jgi:hypothetical protein